MDLFALDTDLFLLINGLPHNIYIDYLFIFLDLITRQSILYFLLILLYYFKHKRSDNFVQLGLFAIVATYIINTLLLKNLFHTVRPYNQAALDFILVGIEPSTYSFPSGHTAISFAFAMIYFLTTKSKRNSVILFLFAILIGFNRIYVGHHFPSDVIGGAFVGGIVSIVTYYVYSRKKKGITT